MSRYRTNVSAVVLNLFCGLNDKTFCTKLKLADN